MYNLRPRVRFYSGNTVTVSKCYCTIVVYAMCTQNVRLFMDDRFGGDNVQK